MASPVVHMRDYRKRIDRAHERADRLAGWIIAGVAAVLLVSGLCWRLI